MGSCGKCPVRVLGQSRFAGQCVVDIPFEPLVHGAGLVERVCCMTTRAQQYRPTGREWVPICEPDIWLTRSVVNDDLDTVYLKGEILIADITQFFGQFMHDHATV